MSDELWTPSSKRSLLDPRTKLLLIFAEAFFVLAANGGETVFWFRTAFTILPFLLLLTAGIYRVCAGGALAAALCLALERGLFSETKGFIAGMIMVLAVVIDRFLPAYLTGAYVIRTTTVSQFKAAMEKLHMPDSITIPMCVVFRLFPTICQESRDIRIAMRMRGVRPFGGKGGKMLEYQIVPMIACSARIGEELSASAVTRGLGKYRKRTNICRIGFGPADACIFVLAAGAAVFRIVEALR